MSPCKKYIWLVGAIIVIAIFKGKRKVCPYDFLPNTSFSFFTTAGSAGFS